MKCLILFFAFLFKNIDCDPELTDSLGKIRQLKAGPELIDAVLEDGPLAIRHEPGVRFGGHWDPNTRTIVVDGTGNQIYTLLFELHNASTEKLFDQTSFLARSGQISREEFIRQVEWIEYQNTFKTSTLIAEGIERGIFPENAQVWYLFDFDKHLRDQRKAGHSEQIGIFYDLLTS